MQLKFLPFLFLLCSCAGNDLIYSNETYECYNDRVIESDYTAVAQSPWRIVSDYGGDTLVWECRNDLSSMPAIDGVGLLEKAVYNMALDESINAVEPDGTLRTGTLWAGVWTRDVSYSTLLAMAYIQPEAAKTSLLKKISEKGTIIQDTGTGGAWPCSSDRQIWTVAVWELYKVTGDRAWLETVYPVAKKTLVIDLTTLYDTETGLVRGESSFIDWREQSYPRWMEPGDIYATECLGTNAVHYQALRCAAQMAALLGDSEYEEVFSRRAAALKDAINTHLWNPEKNYYAQYLASRRGNHFVYDKSETLGQALTVLYGIADGERASLMSEHVPSVDYGTPVFYPWIPDIAPYHNRAVWPFVQAFWMQASAKAGNEEGVLAALAAIYRAAAMFATNQENYVADTGALDTRKNSGNMLWSLSGALSATYRVLAGMDFGQDGLHFRPFVPHTLAADRIIGGFKYRDSVLDIKISGYGDSVSKFWLDGIRQNDAFVPDTLKGVHEVRILMSDSFTEGKKADFVEACNTPMTPVASLSEGHLAWESVDGACQYGIYADGKRVCVTSDTIVTVNPSWKGDVQVVAYSQDGVPSFPTEPVFVGETLDYPFNSVRIEKDSGDFVYTASVPEDGTWYLSWNYANGYGKVNTNKSCGIRTLFVDGKPCGMTVFPQRGKIAWDKWGYTFPVRLKLSAGEHEFRLRFVEPYDENMQITVNGFALKGLRLQK